MPPRWSIRSCNTLRLWGVACLALVSSGAARADAGVEPREVLPPVTAAGAASAGGGEDASPPEAVLAAERLVAAEARAVEAALPVLHLRALGGAKQVDLVPFGPGGEPRPEPMAELARLFAPRTLHQPWKGPVVHEEPIEIDPRLAALLLDISAELGGEPITLVSGHRKPGRGTSRKSFHVRGMAADIAVEGKKPIEVRAAAVRAGAGGVGLYPGFVHVDVRDVPYRWGGGGRVSPGARPSSRR